MLSVFQACGLSSKHALPTSVACTRTRTRTHTRVHRTLLHPVDAMPFCFSPQQLRRRHLCATVPRMCHSCLVAQYVLLVFTAYLATTFCVRDVNSSSPRSRPSAQSTDTSSLLSTMHEARGHSHSAKRRICLHRVQHRRHEPTRQLHLPATCVYCTKHRHYKPTR